MIGACLTPRSPPMRSLQRRTRRCGTVTCGTVPPGVAAPVQYGPRVRAATVYLMHEQFVSKARTAQTMADLFGVRLTPGTVASAVAQAAKTVGPIGHLIADRIAAA